MMYLREKDHGFYEGNFNSTSRSLSKDKKKQQGTIVAEDEHRLVNGDRWSLFSIGEPLEKEINSPGMDRFWERQHAPEVKDWVEGSQSPSASESSSSLSTHESSFSGSSEASSLARMDFLQCAANQPPRFSDRPFLLSHVPELAAISVKKLTGAERTAQQDSVQSNRYECRKQSKAQDLCHEDDIVWNSNIPDGVAVPSAPQQDKQNSDADYFRPLERDCSLEYLDAGFSSDSSSTTDSWASAYSQEFSSESRWQSFDASYDSEDLQLNEDTYCSAVCQTEGRIPVDFHHDIVEKVMPMSSSAWEASSSDTHGSQVINESGLHRENKDVSIEGPSFHTSKNSSRDYDVMRNPTSPTATSSSLSSWVPTSLPSSPGNDCEFYYGDAMHQPASLSIHAKATKVTSTLQQCGTRHANATYMQAMDPAMGPHANILYTHRNSFEAPCEKSSEKPVDNSPQIPRELSETQVNELIPSQNKLTFWIREKHARPAGEKLSGPFKHLLPASHKSGLPHVGAAGRTKSLASRGSKSGHSAPVKEKFASRPLHGYFRFVEQEGLPCYTFFVNNSDEVFFARACKIEKLPNQKTCDWVYSFHCRREAWTSNYAKKKGWDKKGKVASDLVGKMCVSQVRDTDSIGKSGAKETHFVLFASGEHVLEARTSSLDNESHLGASGFLKPNARDGMSTILNATVPPDSQHKDAYQRVTPRSLNVLNLSDGSLPSDPRRPDCSGERRSTRRSDASSLKVSLLPRSKTAQSNIELAAIVINTSFEVDRLNRRSSRNPEQQESVGWGVKFLERSCGKGWGMKYLGKNSIDNHASEPGLEARESEADNCNTSMEITECDGTLEKSKTSQVRQQQHNLRSGKENCLNRSTADYISAEYEELAKKKSRTNANVDITVILPAGDHGLPTGDSDGPTPLLERWSSGGDCDCGGWDLGCGLSIFSTETLTLHGPEDKVALTSHDRINWLSPGNPLKIFTQDYRRRVILGVEKIEASFFSLRFQARISPLQAFATAVAILHEQLTHR